LTSGIGPPPISEIDGTTVRGDDLAVGVRVLARRGPDEIATNRELAGHRVAVFRVTENRGSGTARRRTVAARLPWFLRAETVTNGPTFLTTLYLVTSRNGYSATEYNYDYRAADIACLN
jgi:hypothetical protein